MLLAHVFDPVLLHDSAMRFFTNDKVLQTFSEERSDEIDVTSIIRKSSSYSYRFKQLLCLKIQLQFLPSVLVRFQQGLDTILEAGPAACRRSHRQYESEKQMMIFILNFFIYTLRIFFSPSRS